MYLIDNLLGAVSMYLQNFLFVILKRFDQSYSHAHVALGRLRKLKLNELQSLKYLSQNNSFYNQV